MLKSLPTWSLKKTWNLEVGHVGGADVIVASDSIDDALHGDEVFGPTEQPKSSIRNQGDWPEENLEMSSAAAIELSILFLGNAGGAPCLKMSETDELHYSQPYHAPRLSSWKTC